MIALKRVGRNRLSSKKAVSAVVTTMFFITAAFGLGIVYFQWALGLWSNSLGAADQWTQSGINNMRELLVIETVWLNRSAQPNCSLTVRNIGVTPVTLAAVYTDGTPSSVATTAYVDGTPALSPPNTKLAVGQLVVFKISVTNTPHTFKIVTSKGNNVIVVWKPQ